MPYSSFMLQGVEELLIGHCDFRYLLQQLGVLLSKFHHLCIIRWLRLCVEEIGN